jgi:type IV pilus assembly protein PilZ
VPDNRQHPRKHLHPNAGWALPGRARAEARCRDISLGGCFLETATPPPFGTSIVVFLELPGLLDDDGRPTPAVVTSTVRWTTPQGMGVQFGPMGVRETHALVSALSG